MLLLFVQAFAVAADTTAISCKVTNALQYDPVSDAEVWLTDADGHEVAGKTGADGSATLLVAGPGPFILTGSHDNFVPVRLGSYYPFEGAQVVRRLNDQSFSACELRLKPRGRIEGRVTDMDHNPVPDATVTALWRTYQNPDSLTYMYAVETHTAADGWFEFNRLLPGVFLLRVTPPGDQFGKLRTTYYPHVGDATTASPIRLSAGGTFRADVLVQGASLADLLLTVATVTGRLRNETVTIMRGIDDFSRLAFVGDCCSEQRLEDGRVLLKHIPSGTYIFKVTAVVDKQELEGYSTVELGQRPEYTAEVVLTPALTISAKVVRKKRSDPRPPPPLWVLLTPVNGMLGRMSGGIIADSDDAVTFEHLRPGLYRWGIAGLSASQYAELWANGWSRRDGLIEISPGAKFLEFRIVEGAASVEVKAAGDREVCLGTALVVLPEDPGQPGMTRRASGFGCQFEMGGLPPGSYSVALVSLLEEGEASTPAFRPKLTGAERIRLSPGERRQLTLPIQTLVREF